MFGTISAFSAFVVKNKLCRYLSRKISIFIHVPRGISVIKLVTVSCGF